MKRATLLALLLVPLALGLRVDTARAEGETKVFQEHNFKLTIPNTNWQWHDVTEGAKSSGYVAKLVRRKEGTVAMVDIRVVATDGLPLNELTDEVKSQLSSSLQKLEGTKVTEGMLSGLKGTQVVLKGTDSSGAGVLMRVYSIEAKGKFHQMICRLIDGAETKLGSEVDALRRAYRLLDGAGPVEPNVAPGDAAHEDLSGGSADDWPPNGPKREGRTVVFPTKNLKWTLPEGTPFAWGTVTSNEAEMPKEGGRLLITAVAKQDREAKNDRELTANVAEVILLFQKAEPGLLTSAIVENPRNQTWVAETFFDQADMGRLKVFKDVDVGNHKGAVLYMAGTKEFGNAEPKVNALRHVWVYWVRLKELLYEWRIVLTGGREVDDLYKAPVKALMGAIEFPDTAEWVMGPVGIAGVPPFNNPRGHSTEAEKEVTSVGLTAEKPAGMTMLNIEVQHSPNLRLAWESRTEDKQKYLYFDVQSFPSDSLGKDPEQNLIDQREGQWREAAESTQTVTKGKSNSFRDKWGRGKGLGYEFTGYFFDHPFVERGYVVRYKKYIYWIRFQFGGKDAEKAFSNELKKLKKAVDFTG